MGVYGRSKPYRDNSRGLATCVRCGIERHRSGGNSNEYCLDCAPYRKEMEAGL